MEDLKSLSLINALSYCGLRELPKEDSREYIWIRAIGLVRKSNGSQSYVLLERNSDGNPTCVKDFGGVSVIVSLEKIYPFQLLDEAFMPTFTVKNKETRIDWLVKRGVTDELSELSVRELDKRIINIAAQDALAGIEIG